MIECGPNGGLWELSLGTIGTYTFRASSNEAFTGVIDIEVVTVHNPKVLDIAIMSKYKPIIMPNPSHLPKTTSQRWIGLATMVWMVPERISPESVSTEVSTVMMAVRKLTT